MDQPNKRVEDAESLANAGHWREAADAYAELIRSGRSDYHSHYNFGTVLMHCGRYEGGRDQMREALRHNPGSLDALNNLAAAYIKLGDPCAAEETCRLILAKQADHTIAWTNLGLALSNQARVAEGIEAMQRALEIDPDYAIARQNLLLNLNYLATEGTDLAEVHRGLCAQIPAAPSKPLPNAAGRRLRVGYVSSDFRGHSVAYFMAGVLEAHDRSTFEIFCYSATHAPDSGTARFARLAEHFVDIANAPDHPAAERIEADQIDILVDLGGHTSGNRLGIFALRPAPIQVSYLGYPATTGCPFIDYRLVDTYTDPKGSEPYSTERLVRLPAPFLCYQPGPDAPPTGSLPSLENGHITFGSFNHSSKISDDTLDLWSGVLASVPQSRLFLKARAFSDPGVCERFRDRFERRSIEASRLTFSGQVESTEEHLAAYGRVDIALDTYPYHGTTTTCEALWMGVPVITLVGSLHAARVGLSILTAVGLGSLAVASPVEYVALAAAFAEDRTGLAQLRAQLPSVVANSPLCDRFRFTKGLENAYRMMTAPGN